MSKKMSKKCTMLLVAAMLILCMSVQAFAATSYVKSMTVSKTSVSVKAGSSAKVTAKVTVYKSASKYVTAKSSSTAVAKVSVGKPSSKGVSTITIKGVKKGTAYITVTTKAKNKSKKVISKKIKVTVNYADVSGLKVKASKTSLEVGATAKITTTIAPSTAYKSVTMTSSDKSVATVSSSGTVKAISAGTAVITVKTKGKTSSGAYMTKKITFTVTEPETQDDESTTTDSFTSSDYSVTYTETTQYVNFTFDSNRVTAEELKAEGYTVEGQTASKTVTSPKATYTFYKLPKTLEEVKKIALNDQYGFGPMAAAIAALAGQETAPTRINVTSSEFYKSLNYLNSDKFSIYNGYSVTDNIPAIFDYRYCYFDGATPSNAYTASAPYTFTLELGPYYIPARSNDITYGTTPARYMILISFSGDDSERYCDVWKSSDGNWYLWDDTWQHLVSKVKPVTTTW